MDFLCCLDILLMDFIRSLQTTLTIDPAAEEGGRSDHGTPPVPKAAPWLVIPDGKGMETQAFYNICEPNNRTCRKSIPELSGKSFWQRPSHQGWLVVLCKDKGYNYTPNWKLGDCFLWNPASLENIPLPSLLQWVKKPKNNVLVDCVLSSPPEHGRYHDSVVLFLFSPLFDVNDDPDHVTLLYCHPGDKQWRINKISRDTTEYRLGDASSLHSFKDKLYAMSRHEDSLLEINKKQLVDDNIVALSTWPLEVSDARFRPEDSDGFVTELFYVESEDEILKILIYYSHRCYDQKDVMSIEVMSVEVYRLDFSLMKWEEMNSLGDHVIFVSENTSVCCSAAKLGLSAGGCLYYTLPEDQSLYKFDMNSTGNAVILPCLELQTPWFQSHWVMMMMDGEEEEKNNIASKEAVENRISSSSNETWSHEEHNKGESSEETSPWGILIADMLPLIANCLHQLDYVHFRSVCKANRQVLPIKQRASSSTGCPYVSPWLVFSSGNTYSFVNPANTKETYLINFCEVLAGATIRCQRDGWLLMSREEKVFFYNPFTRDIINLPDLPERYNFSGICFDSSPTAADCAVFAIDQRCLDVFIAIIMRGDDGWAGFDYPNADVKKFMPLSNTPVLYQGAFYCADNNGTLGAFDPDRRNKPWRVLKKPSKQFNDDMHPSFLVECGGDLLLVKLGHVGKMVRILRLDLSKRKWMKVETLGKHMLFISSTSCVSAVAPNSDMENRIYFPRLCLNGEGMLFYSLETCSYHSSGGKQHPPDNFYETEGWLFNCAWIEPNWSKCTAQELDWFK